MELSIIIVSFNTAALTQQCLESIFKAVETNPNLAHEIELLIVDNSSSDGSIDTIKQLKKSSPISISLFANSTNVGFGAANNQAMLHAKGNYVLLLNSDTIIQLETFGQLLKTMQSSTSAKLGILAASLLNPDGSPQPQGGDLPSLSSLFVFAFLLDDLPLIGKLLPSHQHTGRRFQPDTNSTLQQKGWVGGTAMLIRSELVPQIGVLDDQIFMYAEDLEYCWRTRKAGWEVAIDPNAKITHLGSQSSSPAKAIEGEFISLQYVLAKHLPRWQVGLANLLLKQAARNRALVFSILKNPTKAELYRTIAHRL